MAPCSGTLPPEQARTCLFEGHPSKRCFPLVLKVHNHLAEDKHHKLWKWATIAELDSPLALPYQNSNRFPIACSQWAQKIHTPGSRSLVRIPKATGYARFLGVTLKELMRKSSVRNSFWSRVPFVGTAFSR